MSCARQSLYLNYFLGNDQGGATHPYAPLLGLSTPAEKPAVKDDIPSLAAQYEQRWLRLHGSADSGQLKSFFEEQLANYQLSATDLNNFLDVSVGGPDFFFTQNLLHFPSAKIPAATYGNLIHAALSQAHNQVLDGRKLDVPAILKDFERELMAEALAQNDKQYYLQRGQKSLQAYFAKADADFNQDQAVDVNFRNQHASVGDVRLKGSIDRLDLDKKAKTAIISDYKTGSSETRWQLSPKTEEYRKIKMYRYRNQLLFYKLLVDQGSDWGQRGWRAEQGLLRFVEPDDYGRIRTLELTYDKTELERFKKLLQRVWQHIQQLDFPDTSIYPATLEGVLAFQADLLK